MRKTKKFGTGPEKNGKMDVIIDSNHSLGNTINSKLTGDPKKGKIEVYINKYRCLGQTENPTQKFQNPAVF